MAHFVLPLPCMTQPRLVVPGDTLMITRRTLRRHHLFRSDSAIRQLYLEPYVRRPQRTRLRAPRAYPESANLSRTSLFSRLVFADLEWAPSAVAAWRCSEARGA